MKRSDLRPLNYIVIIMDKSENSRLDILKNIKYVEKVTLNLCNLHKYQDNAGIKKSKNRRLDDILGLKNREKTGMLVVSIHHQEGSI